MLKKILCSIIFLASGINGALAEGIQVGATRVIYEGDKNQASVPVSNPSQRAYLIQSWVSKDITSTGAMDTIFLTTPPLFKLEPKSSNNVRIVYNGATLPQDRESMFWLNIKAVPSTAKSEIGSNSLVLAVKTQIKLFYRPAGLSGNPMEAHKQLKFKTQNGKLTIVNPTPYNISFAELKINGLSVDDPVTVMPFSTYALNKKSTSGSTVTWQVINDYGGITNIENNKVT